MTEAYTSWVESVIPRAQQRGHWQFVAEETEAAIQAQQRGDSFAVWRHLVAIRTAAKKASAP